MNQPVPALFDLYFNPWIATCRETKEAHVHECGVGADLAPAVALVSPNERMSILGACPNEDQRLQIADLIHGSPRWMNLVRQCVQLTGAEVVLAAVEVMTFDEGRVGHEAIEVSMSTRSLFVARTLSYKYEPGLVWVDDHRPLHPLNAATALEFNAARLAWMTQQVAYKHSVKYLSTACGTAWSGDEAMLARLS